MGRCEQLMIYSRPAAAPLTVLNQGMIIAGQSVPVLPDRLGRRLATFGVRYACIYACVTRYHGDIKRKINYRRSTSVTPVVTLAAARAPAARLVLATSAQAPAARRALATPARPPA